jgi:integrase
LVALDRKNSVQGEAAKLGQVKIQDLRPEHIQNLYSSLLDDEVGDYTIIKVHTVLHSALQQATHIGMISRNPASYAQPPKEPATEMAILNESQVSQLLVAVNGHRWEALYHLAIVTGMRQMELLGLKWADLDWIRQMLKVERQLIRPDGNGVEFSSPKTRYGKRSVALGGKTVDVLRAHNERQQGERLAAGDKWVENGLIFTNSLGGPIDPRNLLRNFKQLLRDAGLPAIRFHDLRHSAATLMLNAGIPVIVVKRRLGHARASITLDVYGHLIPSMQSEAAELIDQMVTPVAVEFDKTKIES